ncbi:MAG TPA: porin [Alphaproteobacteria bacterium]
MKNILMSTAALAALALVAAAPARADEPALQLGVGGYISGYAVYTDQEDADTAAASDELRDFDFRKDTEVHLSGEVALDNGITAGAHMELLADRADGGATVEESYLYLSSSWGRVNFGEEDGIAYLLQVAAPSADDKVDGIRPDIGTFVGGVGATSVGGTIDYAHDDTNYANKITYITPVFNGFQAGVSYTPTLNGAGTTLNGVTVVGGDADLGGTTAAVFSDDAGDFGNAWEIAARYEGSFDAVDLAIGAGYSTADDEIEAAGDDDLDTWNVGATLGWGAFGLGAAYITTNNGQDPAAADADTNIWVAGVDYTTGPYKLGLSYLTRETDDGVAGFGAEDEEIDRWTAGVIYEWGPGMTFRGAVQWQDAENAGGVAAQDNDGTQVTLGTQLNF